MCPRWVVFQATALDWLLSRRANAETAFVVHLISESVWGNPLRKPYTHDTMMQTDVKTHPMTRLRESLGMTQQQFATAIGISTGSLSEIETGKVKRPRLTPVQFARIIELAGMQEMRAIDAVNKMSELLGYNN